ncbi:HNH endonuclease [Salinibacterium sp. ZJ450]|uniref:HNH endonuclease n=1 Tax=Salinibacterium sp. ZJ450 TaxID=2708338 RepID=UPI001423ECBE
MGTWSEDIVRALTELGGTGTYDQIYSEVANLRSGRPPSWKQIVQRTIQDRSSDSVGYKGNSDLFFSVEGIGRGIWGLRGLAHPTPIGADMSGGNETPGRIQQATYRVLRDTTLARQLKLIHRNACQLCGLALGTAGGATYSEAHHIIPLGAPHNGPDVPGNIIVLCPNDHALCDMGAIILNRHEIRQVDGHEISEESISYHNGQIVRAS